jgi:hypothetical protein
VNEDDDFDGFELVADSYCAHMVEAVHAIVHASDIRQMWELHDNPGSAEWYDLAEESMMLAKYGFLLACIATEAGANSLLKNTCNLPTALYSDLEKLQTLNKFELFALVNGTPLDRGRNEYARMLQVVKLRNEFFHPKRAVITIENSPDERSAQPLPGGRAYPSALEAVESNSAKAIVADALSFVSWVIFDTCKLKAADGARLLLISALRMNPFYDSREHGARSREQEFWPPAPCSPLPAYRSAAHFPRSHQ